MLVARRVPVRVGLVRFPDRPDTYSVVVKVTYDIAQPGWAVMRHEDADPLRGDEHDGAETVVYPSDFSPLKLACDVVLVGPALSEERPAPARIWASRVDKSADAATLLAALSADPTDPLAQDAPSDQRLPWPPFPIEVGVEHRDIALDAILPGPLPSAALVYDNDLGRALALSLHADGILIDPIHRVCHVTFRGCFQHEGSVHHNLLLVVDPLESLASVTLDDVDTWPREPIEMDPAAMADATFALAASADDLDEPTDEPERQDTLTLTRPLPEPPPRGPTGTLRPPPPVLDPAPKPPADEGTAPFFRWSSPPPPLVPREVAEAPDQSPPADEHRHAPPSRPLMVIGTVGTRLGYGSTKAHRPPSESQTDEATPASGHPDRGSGHHRRSR